MRTLTFASVVLCCAAAVAGCGGGTTTSGSTSGSASSATNTVASAPHAEHRTSSPTSAAAPKPSSEGTTGATQTQTSSTTSRKPEEELGKTPFLAATGSGFGAFHAYISKPLRRGSLKQGASKQELATAATAASYATREIAAAGRAAAEAASLHPLVGPLEALARRMRVIATSLDRGQVDSAAIVAARGEVDEVSRAALALGQPIQEVTPKLP